MKRYLLGILALFLMLFGLAAPARAWTFEEMWDTVTCPADIDCTLRAAAVASQNFLFKAGVGKDFEELTDGDIEAMINGKWNTGLASGVSEIGKLAYDSPPVPRFADYIRYELSDNLLNTPSYAVTFGEAALNPVVDFWRGMRNIAYALFMVVMVVIGFMIILRREISPRVVVTFTNALPRIVTGLVLITFSFPLIALAVDVGIVFGSRLVSDVVSQASNITIEEVPEPPAADAEEVGAAPFVSTTLPKIIGGFLLGINETVAEPLTGLILGAIFIIGGIIIFGLAIFKLLISYAWLLIYAIFSPLLILFGSLPGQEGSITDLGKNVLAKVLAFPATLFFLILGWYMATTTTVTPPDFGSEVGQFGDIIGRAFILRANVLLALMALVMLFAAYKAPSLIEEGLGAGGKKPRKK
jgi:hypothetical protein